MKRGAFMQYTMKSGILYRNNAQNAAAQLRSMFIGPIKQIYSSSGELLLETNIRYLDADLPHTGNVRNKEYTLTDREGKVIASAFPQYAEGDDPEWVGWPICRMPRVDRAKLLLHGAEHILIMHNSQNYTMKDLHDADVLRIMHRGLIGGWLLEDRCGFTPEILCGLFTFCRYIEMENEFIIV